MSRMGLIKSEYVTDVQGAMAVVFEKEAILHNSSSPSYPPAFRTTPRPRPDLNKNNDYLHP